MSSDPMARESTSSQAGSSRITLAATSPTSSSESSASTINAAGENTSIRDPEPTNELGSDLSTLSTSPNFDWRSRSVSAPASRSSSFAKNLDQLAFLNQSAHRFPITLPSVPSSNGSHGTDNTERVNSPSSPHITLPSPSVNTQHIASGSRPRTIASRSTPTSPYLSPALSSASTFSRSASNYSHTGEAISSRQNLADSRNSPAARARAALFSPGSGFTPAHDLSISRPSNPSQRPKTNTVESRDETTNTQNVITSDGRTRRRRARSISATATEVTNDQGEGRSRASSASAGSTSSPHTRPQRARAQSARTSPTLMSTQLSGSYNPGLQISTSALDQGPHRTNSVPHFAQYSPVIYSYGYRHCDVQGGMAPTATAFVPATPSDLSAIGGYFALPPAISSFPDPMSLSPREAEESPPPYTPSETNLRAMNVQVHPQPATMIANRPEHSPALSRSASGRGHNASRRTLQDPEEDEEEDDNALSFSTNTRRHRSPHQSASSRLADSMTDTHIAQPISIRSDDETETERERGPESPSMRSNESLSSPVAHHRVLEGEPLAKEEWNYIERLERPSKLRQFVLMYLVFPLRLLATVPGIIGTFWLMRNAFVVGWSSSMLWRKPIEGMQAQPSSLEFALSALYSMTTAYHAYSFTTLLLRRWLHYYSLLPSLIRLIALQALCWPLVRLTLYTMGPRNPLPAWIVISTTTACSDTIARWVVSNITDESDGLSNAAMGIGNGTGVNGDLSAYNKGRYGRYSSNSRVGRTSLRSQSSVIRTKSRGGIGMAFWRAIMGAPPRQRSGRLSATLAAAEHGRPHGFVTESEAESDAESFMSPTISRTRLISPTRGFNNNTSSSSINATRRLAELRRRRNGGEALSPQMDPASEGLTSAGEGEEDDELGDLPSTLDRTMALNAQHKNIERVGRIFHWDVAIRRNILPIGILAYMTMWVLLIEDVRLRL